ncbi:hypothetical protein TCAL_00068 [Tigriopus californicus]|uniref:Lipoma HMGIC fusion partner-like 2 protein n=1 Tax=Tigriopus californicus TaxID=6832 RepID=A0A553PHJ2_TIGCA|nr:LHFPL tetraspan subfamily member 2 protein-like [Tigriopus californicus]XP_059082824.1 LHFPL tetraspan subfamily member 2 protein-like [Tigriopus californicus]XP_059082825.1 LHFPL tetraspan subfamily member 2 protein-like [Tigriopus californicus]TRY77150.1 hypothetical protein TCAL_00068 [Tigriopus californicus]|eukprot:TCALIF_00068-PA protein Name:"Similar to lhfpl2 Lipoma HMGIC fusion partner-like 2 protein (Danio rerio)" AED:0.02 eAED:0.02 QI:333/1/1/1/0.75/0.6/5/658/248
MCTIIVTIRTVLWYVMSLTATLLILVSLFTDRWLIGTFSTTSLTNADTFVNSVSGIANDIRGGDFAAITQPHVGLFLYCKVPEGKKFFEGECIPNMESIQTLFTDLDDRKYPHTWRGAVLVFIIGLALMLLTDVFALLTVCCRQCLCCSVFTCCGSIQSFASMMFILGLVAYPAGWGSEIVSDTYCAGQSQPFMLGPNCSIGVAYWLAVAGTLCTVFSSSLAIWAYKSTKSVRSEMRQEDGERCICIP